jgi:putative flippase GtrA
MARGIRPFARNSVFRYLAAGVLAFAFDLGMLAFLKNVLEWPLWLATSTAFLASFAFTYSIQRFFSFNATSPHGAALVKYAALVGFNTLATVSIVSLSAVTPLGWVGGKVIATGVTTAWNYFAYRYWIFRSHQSSEKD